MLDVTLMLDDFWMFSFCLLLARRTLPVHQGGAMLCIRCSRRVEAMDMAGEDMTRTKTKLEPEENIGELCSARAKLCQTHKSTCYMDVAFRSKRACFDALFVNDCRSELH